MSRLTKLIDGGLRRLDQERLIRASGYFDPEWYARTYPGTGGPGRALGHYLETGAALVGDESFREKSEEMLGERLQTRGAIVVSHSAPLLKRMCEAAVVIENGKADWFDDVEEALRQHRRNMQMAPLSA